MLVATLVVVGLVLGPAGAQRRRDRSRVRQGITQEDDIEEQETKPRRLFDDSESKRQNGFEKSRFFPEFDWSDPSFTDMSAGAMPEWGFTESKKLKVSPNENVENNGYRESEQKSSRKVIRTKLPAGRELVKDRADRRSDIGGRRRVRPGRFQIADERKFVNDRNDRLKSMTRNRQKENYRLPNREVQLDDDEDFKIPSNVDIVKPVSLSINAVKVLDYPKPAENKETVFNDRKEDHPGSLSFGIFGGGNIGGDEIKSPELKSDSIRVTTYRPANFLPANFKVTTYRPKNFQPIVKKFTTEADFDPLGSEKSWNDNGWRRNSYEREENDWSNNQRPIPPVKENTAFFKPVPNYPLRPFVQKSPIRPQRWRPPTSERPSYNDERRLIGSPYFKLDREDMDPDYDSREIEEAKRYTDEKEFELKEDITNTKLRPSFTKYEPPIKKQTIFLPTLMPPEEEVKKKQFQPTLKPTLEPTNEKYGNNKILNIDFLSEKEESIENVFIPTQVSTTEKIEKTPSSSPSYTSFRDAERKSDQSYNMKKLQEKIEATTPDPLPNYPSGGVNSRNDERWKDQKFNVLNAQKIDEIEEIDNVYESQTTPKFEVDRTFMEGRNRGSSTLKPNYYEKIEDNFGNVFDDNDHEFNPRVYPTFPPLLENLSEENTYSKTHIRAQKIRPRKPEDAVTEKEVENEIIFDDNFFEDNVQEFSSNLLPTLQPLENISKENAYSKTQMRTQKIRPRKPEDSVKEKDIKNDISIDEKIDGTKLEGAKENNYGKTFLNILKTRDGGKIDYMHLKMADITREIPMSKLKNLLNNNGFTPSDIFNKNPKALEVVGKAMKSKSYMNEQDVKVKDEITEDPFEGLNIKVKEWTPSDKVKVKEEITEDPFEGLDIKVKEWTPSDSFNFGLENEEEAETEKEDLNVNSIVEKISSTKKEIKIPWPKRPTKKDFRSRYNLDKNKGGDEDKYSNSFVPQTKKEETDKPEEKYVRKDSTRRSWANRDKETKDDFDYDEKEEKDIRQEYPRRISWGNRGKDTKKFNRVENEEEEKEFNKESSKRISWGNRGKVESAEDNDVASSEADIDAEIEAEASTMSFKSLVKKISPMSLSEVLSKVGFSLPDVMRGNKEAIKQVLKFHRKATQPTTKKPLEAMKDNDDPFEGLNVKVKEWIPSETFLTETTTPKAVTTTTQETTTTSRARGKSSINIFRNSNLFKNLRTSTIKSTTTSIKPTTSSTHRFGERTSKKNIDISSTPTNIKHMKSRQKTKKVTTIDTISERNDVGILDETTLQDEMAKDSETTVAEVENTTTPYASLNMTLANLNMTANDVMEKKNLTVPGLDQIFIGLTKKENDKDTEIIYGAKPAVPKEKKRKERPKTYTNTDFGGGSRKERPKTYTNTDFGGGGRKERPKTYTNTDFGGGNRFRWDSPSSFGGGYGGGGGLVTNRRTTKRTTTKIPITYFNLNGEREDESLTNDILNGEYTGVVDYEYYEGYEYYNEPAYEVPSGVKSALIASSVVGGLAVSIFLCIFMLCLWKQMKSKLRLSGEFEDHNKAGFLSSLFFKKTKKVSKKETSGYFNKVPPINEQHYSTTSSEEY